MASGASSSQWLYLTCAQCYCRSTQGTRHAGGERDQCVHQSPAPTGWEDMVRQHMWRQMFASSPVFAATNLACERCFQLYLHCFVEHSWNSADTAKSSFEGLIRIYTSLLKVTLITVITSNKETRPLFQERSVLTKTLKRFIARIKIIVNGL